MRPAPKLVLRRESLSDLTPDELRRVIGGDSLSGCLPKELLRDFTDWQSICWCYTN